MLEKVVHFYEIIQIFAYYSMKLTFVSDEEMLHVFAFWEDRSTP